MSQSQSSAKNLPKKLPQPSDHGTYWLGEPTDCPAIFRSGRRQGKWFASLGDMVGDFALLTCDGDIRYFDSPKDALNALRAEKPMTLTFRSS